MRCEACGATWIPVARLGCDCGAVVHVVCRTCERERCGGTVLELGAKPPVRARICPDGAELAEELMG